MLGLGDELRREVRVMLPWGELASCCWVSGLGLSLLAGGGPPSSPFWALCPVWPQLWFWLSGWLSVLGLLSSGETKMVGNKSKWLVTDML